MRKEEVRAIWLERVEKFKVSGQTQTDFCVAQGLQIKQFSYWVRKYRTKEQIDGKSSLGWLELRVKEQTEKLQNNALNIRFGQAIVEVKPGFDQQLLLDVLKTLKAI